MAVIAISPTPTASPDPAEPLLATQTPAARLLTQEMRALVRDALPHLEEKVHLGWGAIHYRTGTSMRGVVVALLPRPAYVNLEFAAGVDLPDPTHRLEGTGKRMRHVKIHSAADVHHPDVRTLLEAAARRRGLI